MLKNLLLFVCGALIGGLVVWKAPAFAGVEGEAKGGKEAAKDAGKDAAKDGKDAAKAPAPSMADDVARLKNITPNLSHVMADVAFQYSNLWFAGEKKNWPLAMFYWNETRGRLRWMLRINPTPKTPDGEVVNAQGIWDGLENSQMEQLKLTITNKDQHAFEQAYKTMLEGCYSCHKSAGRPYLRPMVPTALPQTIINYDPDAKWP